MGKVKCLNCGTILESTYRHDYKTCDCENKTMVDGGNDYLRYGGKDFSKIETWNEVKQEWVNAARESEEPEGKSEEPDQAENEISDDECKAILRGIFHTYSSRFGENTKKRINEFLK